MKSYMDKQIANIIREFFEMQGVKITKLLLFGSHARGDFREDSDWDFLAVINKELDFNAKWEIIKQIKRALAKQKIPNDIIVKSESQFNKMKTNVGSIVFYANKEGIEV